MQNDKTLQLTFYKGETSWIKILEFTKWELIWFYIPKILFNNELTVNPYLYNKLLNIFSCLRWDIYLTGKKSSRQT